jgi:hypothetical protein
MRAIIHLGFFPGFCLNRLIAERALSESVSGWNQGINGWRECAILRHAGNSLPKFLRTRINRLQTGQNAAVLIFDLGTVDIR